MAGPLRAKRFAYREDDGDVPCLDAIAREAYNGNVRVLATYFLLALSFWTLVAASMPMRTASRGEHAASGLGESAYVETTTQGSHACHDEACLGHECHFGHCSVLAPSASSAERSLSASISIPRRSRLYEDVRLAVPFRPPNVFIFFA